MRTQEGLPYIEPVNGAHAGSANRERDRIDAVQYLTNGHRILPGFGLHRKNDATESWAA